MTSNDTTQVGADFLSAGVHVPADADVEGLNDEVVRTVDAFHQKRSCKIIVDSSSDFSPAVLKRLGVGFLPFSYLTPEGEFEDDLWESQSPHDFYEAMRKDPSGHYSTFAVSPGRYLEVFEEAAKEGTPTIYVGLTAGLSSSLNNAEQAAEMLKESYPDFELYVLDPRCDSAACELLVLEMMHQAAMGLSAREVFEWASDARYFVHGYFMLENFDALARGGRIPPAAAQVGSKLDIKPELSFDTNGALTLRGMNRGRRKALRAILADFEKNYCFDEALPLGIVTTDADKDADWLEAQVRKVKGCGSVPIIRSSVSPLLGCHVGPDMVALVFWGGDRREKMSLTDRIARKVRTRG